MESSVLSLDFTLFFEFYFLLLKHHNQFSKIHFVFTSGETLALLVKLQTLPWLSAAVKVTHNLRNDTMFFFLYPFNLILSQVHAATRTAFSLPCCIKDKVSGNRPEFPPRTLRLAKDDGITKKSKRNRKKKGYSCHSSYSCHCHAAKAETRKHQDVLYRAWTQISDLRHSWSLGWSVA